MMTYDVSTGDGLTIFKICNSADYYQIVEATEIVGSRRIVGTSYGHPVETARKYKNGIVRSSQANRRSNVTNASVRNPRDSVQYPLKVCGVPTTTVRSPCVLYQNVD